MTETLTIRWSGASGDLGRRLKALSQRTKRSRASYVTAAVADHIERWEMEAELVERAESISSDQLRAELGWPEPTRDEKRAAWAMVR